MTNIGVSAVFSKVRIVALSAVVVLTSCAEYQISPLPLRETEATLKPKTDAIAARIQSTTKVEVRALVRTGEGDAPTAFTEADAATCQLQSDEFVGEIAPPQRLALPVIAQKPSAMIVTCVAGDVRGQRVLEPVLFGHPDTLPPQVNQGGLIGALTISAIKGYQSGRAKTRDHWVNWAPKDGTAIYVRMEP